MDADSLEARHKKKFKRMVDPMPRQTPIRCSACCQPLADADGGIAQGGDSGSIGIPENQTQPSAGRAQVNVAQNSVATTYLAQSTSLDEEHLRLQRQQKQQQQQQLDEQNQQSLALQRLLQENQTHDQPSAGRARVNVAQDSLATTYLAQSTSLVLDEEHLRLQRQQQQQQLDEQNQQSLALQRLLRWQRLQQLCSSGLKGYRQRQAEERLLPLPLHRQVQERQREVQAPLQEPDEFDDWEML